MTEEAPQSPMLKLIFAGKTPVQNDVTCLLECIHCIKDENGNHDRAYPLMKFQLSDIESGHLAQEVSFAISTDLEALIAELERDETQLHNQFLDKLDGADVDLTSIYSQDNVQVLSTTYALSMDDGRYYKLFKLREKSPSYKDLLRVADSVYFVLDAGIPPVIRQSPFLFRPSQK